MLHLSIRRQRQMVIRARPPAELEDVSRAVMAAIKWAHKGGADSAVEQLHDAFAEWTLSAYGWRQFGKAALHFSRGADASG